MRKISKLIFLIPLVFLSGCSQEYETPESGTTTSEISEKSHNVVFYNYDGSIIDRKVVPHNGYASYTGSTPKRESTDEHIEYVFAGWDKNPSICQIVRDTDFTAVYNEIKYAFGYFYNYDDTLICDRKVPVGGTINVDNIKPERTFEGTDKAYRFIGWDNSLENVQSDTNYIAQFELLNRYEVIFQNFDGTLLQKSYVLEGDSVDYHAGTPTREYSGTDKVYRFSGWDVSLSNIQSNVTITAQYDLLNVYVVTFQNYNGSVLYTTNVVEGDNAVYSGSTPTRPETTSGDYKTKYTFKGWNKSLDNITSDLTVTAEYTSKTYNYVYSNIISSMKDYVIDKGGYSEGTYGYVFSIFTSSGYTYIGMLQMYGYDGDLYISLTSVKTDSTGTKSTQSKLYLADYWDSGYFDFEFEQIQKNQNNVETLHNLGYGELYGPTFSSSTTLSFNRYYGETNESVAAYNAALMISISLDKFASASSWNMKSLGFNNYNY